MSTSKEYTFKDLGLDAKELPEGFDPNWSLNRNFGNTSPKTPALTFLLNRWREYGFWRSWETMNTENHPYKKCVLKLIKESTYDVAQRSAEGVHPLSIALSLKDGADPIEALLARLPATSLCENMHTDTYVRESSILDELLAIEVRLNNYLKEAPLTPQQIDDFWTKSIYTGTHFPPELNKLSKEAKLILEAIYRASELGGGSIPLKSFSKLNRPDYFWNKLERFLNQLGKDIKAKEEERIQRERAQLTSFNTFMEQHQPEVEEMCRQAQLKKQQKTQMRGLADATK